MVAPLTINIPEVFPPLPQPDLPVGGRLGHFANNWEKVTKDKWVLSVVKNGYKIPFDKKPILSPSPLFLSQTESKALEEEVQKLLLKGAVERVYSEDPGYYSRIFLVPKKNGKLRLIIDLSKLNTFLNIQSFSMETANKVRNAILPKDWTFSIELTDAYLHVPIHVTSRKFLCFCLKGKVFQFRALPFGLATSPFVFTRLMLAIATHLRVGKSYSSLSLSGRLVSQKSESSRTDQRQTIYSSADHISWSHNQPRKIRTNSLSELCIHKDGVQNCREYSSGTMGQSSSHFTTDSMVPISEVRISMNVSVTPGETKCNYSICNSGQIAAASTSDGSFLSVETTHSSSRAQNLYHRSDQNPSEMVGQQGSVYSGSSSQTSSCKSHCVFRCECLGLGCPSRTGGCSVSWCLDPRPIPSAYQCTGNESCAISIETVPEHNQQLLSHDSDRQCISSGLYMQRGGDPFSISMHGGVGDSPLVSQQGNLPPRKTHTREKQYPRRPVVKDIETDINGMVPGSDNLQCNLHDDGSSEHRPVRDPSQQQTSVVCISHSRQESSFSRCLVNDLGQDSRVWVSSISHNPSYSEQNSLASVQDSSDCSILATSGLVSRASTATSSSSHFSRFSSKSSKSTKWKNLSSESSNACLTRLDIIKQYVRDRKILQKIADHVS